MRECVVHEENVFEIIFMLSSEWNGNASQNQKENNKMKEKNVV